MSEIFAEVAARKGRGAASNRAGRFEAEERLALDDGWGRDAAADPDLPPLRTDILPDKAKTVIARNASPDVPFNQSVNPYRGCEHGCVYCFARPSHSYLGLSPGLDFETKLFAKHDAAALLRKELSARGYRAETLQLGANTDPYQPAERKLGITREILELLHACDHPVSVTTKSDLVLRDLDILAPMAAKGLASVAVSITTLDGPLARVMEPRAPAPAKRLAAVRALTDAGVPTAVLFAPVIPAVNDTELEAVLAAAAAAGATAAGYVLLRLPLELKTLFEEWLDAHFKDRKARVLSRLADMRGGQLYQTGWGTRQTGTGVEADLLARRFNRAAKELGLLGERSGGRPLRTGLFRPPARETAQLSLF